MPEEKPTTERVQEALDEHRALLWEQHQKLTRLLQMVERDLQKLDELMTTVSPRPARRIVDQIVAYLEKNGATADDIVVEAMVKAGAAAGRRDSVKQIRDSLAANMTPRHPKPKLKRVNKLVGLSGWGEERFR